MYTNKQNVLQLVALMRAHGVKKCVLCPGSRDIPIVQSILQCEDFETFSITDERSAGFFAIGLSLQSNCKYPVAVVVTSGSALLGLHPAVSEAFYQQVPLLIISADRPAAWIGQMDGQTLPQAGVFNTLVKKSVNLVEVQSDEDRWFNNRMINEAILELDHHGRGPVHINVPISDPFFEFNTPDLPNERVITRVNSDSYEKIRDVYKKIHSSEIEGLDCEGVKTVKLAKVLNQFSSIMLVLGQSTDGMGLEFDPYENNSYDSLMFVVSESIANVANDQVCTQIDQFVTQCLTNEDGEYHDFLPGSLCSCRPSLLITVGGHIISKNLKKFLRTDKPRHHIHVSENGEVVDLFKCLSTVVEENPKQFLQTLKNACNFTIMHNMFIGDPRLGYQDLGAFAAAYGRVKIDHENVSMAIEYSNICWQLSNHISQPSFTYSHMQAMQMLRESIPMHSVLHLANSSTVRYDQLFNVFNEDKYKYLTVLSNRGVNGIEGSLSTAIGYAAASDRLNFIVIGDLSFFYDMNALWNDYVGNNVRIVLLNNGGGEIFHALPGLKLSDKEKKYVTAQHNTDAKAWAESRGFEYSLVTNGRSLKSAIKAICTEKQLEKPQFVEVVTEAQSDATLLKKVLLSCSKKAKAQIKELYSLDFEF